MKNGFRALLLVGALAFAGGLAVAAGVNNVFDTFVSTLTAANETASTSDQAHISAAIATLNAASTNVHDATKNVQSLQKAIKQLVKLPTTNEAVGGGVNQAVGAMYAQCVVRMGQVVFQQGTWLQSHMNLSDLSKSAKEVQAYGAARTKLDNAQNSTTLSAAAKLKVFLASSKVFDKAYKFYGGTE